MKLSLKETLAKILSTPLIIEQGTSGIWTYRKWSDGTSECWGEFSIRVNAWQAWGSLYEGTPGGYVDYPQNLFIEVPLLLAFARLGAGDNVITPCGVESYSGASSTRTPMLYPLRPNSSGATSKNVLVALHAKGRWKSFVGG